ncbi:unnamed protein product [Lampetra fluviatilis]
MRRDAARLAAPSATRAPSGAAISHKARGGRPARRRARPQSRATEEGSSRREVGRRDAPGTKRGGGGAAHLSGAEARGPSGGGGSGGRRRRRRGSRLSPGGSRDFRRSAPCISARPVTSREKSIHVIVSQSIPRARVSIPAD